MKQYRVTISDEALGEVRKYLDYLIAQHANEAAERWWSNALRSVYSLDRMPHRCPRAPEDAHSERTIRMLIVRPGLFLYTVDEANRVVRVLRFRHGAQEPKEIH